MCYLLCRNWSQISLKKKGGEKEDHHVIYIPLNSLKNPNKQGYGIR